MSQKKRLAEKRKREEALKKELQSRKRMQISIIAIVVVVVGIIAGAIIYDLAKESETKLDYSIGLDANGRIKGVDTSKCVELADLNQLNMNPEDYYPSEDEEDSYIQMLLASYPFLDEKKGEEVADGDVVAVLYKCFVDGEELPDEGSGDNPERIVIGSSDYPEEFEEQILSHKTGESFSFTMPFPLDYSNPDVAGLDAEFEITIKGKYVDSEFNDEFIERNFGGLVDGTEDFLEKYRKDSAETDFDDYVKDYLTEGSKVDVPAAYLKKMVKYTKAKDLKQMASTNETFLNLYGYEKYKNVYEMRNTTKADYENEVLESAKEEAVNNLIYQAAFDSLGLSITEDDINATIEGYAVSDDETESVVERFGRPYLVQQTMHKAVDTYLKESYNLP
ncbi:MAG: FKBP-type peptidyl-prolyl cis-trans isomerase [Lachnospiraceae bacterium]|nr:FKBP-type peptidyl-prolyl cis-trans isomerase [Lachnospiraceae bacterium]